MRIQQNYYIDDPSRQVHVALVSYEDITSAAGNALGTTLVCANLAGEPSYQGFHSVKILDGNAAGQIRPVAVHPAGGNTITVASAWTDNTGAVVQIIAGTRFVILSTGGGGGGGAPVIAPSIGLWMFGECDPGMAASLTAIVCANLAGFPDDIFNNEFWMQVIHNDNAAGAAPEREWRRITDYAGATGAFTTDAFTANVEAGDLIAIVHESIMSIEILGYGTLDASSATVPADSARPGAYAWETDDYFNGCLLMTTEGAARFAPRRIIDYINATGVFALDLNNPFPALPGLVDYIIISGQCEFVPGADGTANAIPSDVIGGKSDTAVYTPDNVSSIIRYLKGMLDTINMGARPAINFYEGWQDEAGIDANIWTVTNPATGTAWARGAAGAYLRATSVPNANETCRLVSDQRWVVAPDIYGTNTILRSLVLEFELKLTNVANIDNVLSFLGLSTAANDNRGSNNIIAWGLTADVLQSITDDAGAETVNTGFGETLTNWNKLKIKVYSGHVKFFINEAEVADHPNNLPDFPMYFNFFVDTEAGGAATIEVGVIRCWMEDIAT